MGRKLRILSPLYFYHIVCRGNRRDPLFMDERDIQAFIFILRRIHERFPFEIASFCLMTNHYHLQLKSQEHSISKIMALLNKQYANYYNTRYNLTGHVFEKRFYDSVILAKKGMLEVSRYIHLNPIEANIVIRPEDYLWSSYHLFFINEDEYDYLPFFNPGILLDEMEGDTLQKRREEFRIFHSLRDIEFDIYKNDL